MNQHIKPHKNVSDYPAQAQKLKVINFNKVMNSKPNKRFQNRSLSEFTESAANLQKMKLQKIKNDLARKKKEQLKIVHLPQKDTAEVKLHPPELTEQPKDSTSVIGWINKKIVAPILKVAAVAAFVITLGTVTPDSTAAPKPQGGTELVEGKKGSETKKPEIFGQYKYFDDLNFDSATGKLTIVGGRWDGSVFPMRGFAQDATNSADFGKKYDKTFSCEGKPLGLVFFDTPGKDGYVGMGAYVIYEDAIFVIKLASPTAKASVAPIWAHDGTKIFTHEGAIYVDQEGNMLASTSTTLLGYAKKWGGPYLYADSFSGFPKLERPTFTGRGREYADLRDPSLVINQQIAKIQIDMVSGIFSILHDDLVIGAR